MIRVSVVGGSGYVGGELLRLLLMHPECEIGQVVARRSAGRPIHSVHPNLRGHLKGRFVPEEELEACDVLILALPHGSAAQGIERYAGLAERVVDLSADFRLADGPIRRRFYDGDHPAPDWQERFVYGLPEVNRTRLRDARHVSGVGCNATAVNLAMLPLVRAGVLDPARGLIAEVKAGSSEGGNASSAASHHPERSGVVRSFSPVGHRHTAEVEATLEMEEVHLSITSVEMVRGALATCHVFTHETLDDRALWGIYREHYGSEPFVRLVHDAGGIHRHPEPKILTGSNDADVGWSYDPKTRRLVALCAIDNLMKGAAGTALQCLNLMCGFEETTGLSFPGLHPV